MTDLFGCHIRSEAPALSQKPKAIVIGPSIEERNGIEYFSNTTNEIETFATVPRLAWGLTKSGHEFDKTMSELGYVAVEKHNRGQHLSSKLVD